MAQYDDFSSTEPLVRAALEGNLDRLRQIFHDCSDDEKARSLTGAAAVGHAEIVRELLSLGVDPDKPAEIVGLSAAAPPLYFALLCGMHGVARLLVDAGASMDATEPGNGHSILAELVHDSAPIEILDAALELGADVNDGGLSGYTPLGAALYRSRGAVARWLVGKGADPNKGRTTWDAFTFSGIVPLRLVIEAGADIGRRYLPDVTLLELAAEYNRPLHFDYLLAKGCDPSRLEADLPLASSAGLTHAVKSLLAKGEQAVDQPDRHGRTPLAMAVASDRTEVVRLLLEAGADPNQLFVCEWQEPDWGEMQLFHHHISSWHEDQSSMLAIAVCQENYVATAMLLDAGADPNLTASSWTPLHFACANGLEILAEMLLLGGAGLEARNEQGNTPLLLAVDWEKPRVYQVLKQYGADLRAVDEEGFTALAIAALNGNAELVQALLDDGLDPDQANQDGFTPLMQAAEGCQLETVRVLLRRGADPSLRDSKGRTALDLAIEQGNECEPEDDAEWDDLVEFLRTNS
ncbi:MAG: ankyrin repeat domain-containing protein [Planctomycetota bacterium]